MSADGQTRGARPPGGSEQREPRGDVTADGQTRGARPPGGSEQREPRGDVSADGPSRGDARAANGGGDAASPGTGSVLAVTLAIQVASSLASTATPALAPVIAADLGVPARWVGSFVSLVYAGAMAASVLTGAAVARYGAIRVSQACVVLAAIGVAGVAATPASTWGVAALAAVVLGFGYGPVTPASSHVLARTASAGSRNLVFSIKQTGVPAGAALAGIALPVIALAFGWRWTLFGVAAGALAVAWTAQPLRASLDADRDPSARMTIADGFASLRRVLRDRSLAPLAWLAFLYAATQVSLMSFLVVHATTVFGWTLVAAGFALAVATCAGVAGRLAWGIVADRRDSADVLPVIGLGASACALMLAFAPATWPAPALLVICGLFGATAIGWNGVHLAELARRAPPGEVGAMTAAASIVAFAGIVAGPFVFGLLSALGPGTRVGFAMTAVLSGLGAVGYWLRERRKSVRR